MITTNNCSAAYGPALPTKLELMGIRFADAGGDGGGAGGGDGGDDKGDKGGNPKDQPQTFTQAQLDAIVAQRLDQQAKNKFGDYDALKAKAEGAKSLEEKVSELGDKLAASELRSLRSEIATKYGISAADRDLFLTGSDEASLNAQAKSLADRDADKKKKGNVAPKEGTTTNQGDKDAEIREFTRDLFGSSDD